MSERLIRIYKPFYIDEIKSHLLMVGALSGICAHCKQMDIAFDEDKCPSCAHDFKYIAFQNMKDHFPKVKKLQHERPNLIFIDYEDFKKVEGEERARGILG